MPPAPRHVNSVYVYVRMRERFLISISITACVFILCELNERGYICVCVRDRFPEANTSMQTDALLWFKSHIYWSVLRNPNLSEPCDSKAAVLAAAVHLGGSSSKIWAAEWICIYTVFTALKINTAKFHIPCCILHASILKFIKICKRAQHFKLSFI